MARLRFKPHCHDPIAHGGECDCLWAEERLKAVPPAFRAHVKRRYDSIENRYQRNTWLREFIENSPATKWRTNPFIWTHQNGMREKIDLANRDHQINLVELSDQDIRELAHDLTQNHKHLFPLSIQFHHRLEPRLRRHLRRSAKQAKEMWALSLKLVGQGKNRAVSDLTFAARKQQLENQKDWLDRTTVQTEDGEEISLSKIAEQTRKNRIAEIITITKGIEKEAAQKGLQAVFITLTAPARFHPNPSKGSSKWDGSTPEQAKKWLTTEWMRTRARLAKAGIQTPGMRVTEAHQDGCPHMHMMIWVDPDFIDRVIKEFQKSPGWDTEAGAKFVIIGDGPGSKASASSYVLKYVLKTLSTSDAEAKKSGADREDAWRSTWGARAIQFFGIPVLDLWRTLRKSKPEDVTNAVACAARAAAIGGRYDAFLELAGGLAKKKSDRPLQIRTEHDDEQIRIKTILHLDTLAGVIGKIKAKLTTKPKPKVTVIHNCPRDPQTQNQKQAKTGFPPPALAPPLPFFALS